MATVHSDWLGGTNGITEESGVVTSATRTMLVTGLSSTDTAIYNEAPTYCGVDIGDAYPGNSNLVCKTRDVSIFGSSDNRKARVVLGYASLAEDETQFIFHCTSSVSQETTNSDAKGNAISLSYTYPSDYWNTELAGTVGTQLAQMEVLLPERNLHATGVIQCADPDAVVKSWIGFVNSTPWKGEQANKWICIACNYDHFSLSASPPKYKFTFEFQCKRRGFTQLVYFRRADDGEIPADVVYGAGYKRVIVQGYRDYTELFS